MKKQRTPADPIAAAVDCRAIPDRYEAATMHCAACGLKWETSDPNPPRCPMKLAVT
jgi:hypothetical protein